MLALKLGRHGIQPTLGSLQTTLVDSRSPGRVVDRLNKREPTSHQETKTATPICPWRPTTADQKNRLAPVSSDRVRGSPARMPGSQCALVLSDRVQVAVMMRWRDGTACERAESRSSPRSGRSALWASRDAMGSHIDLSCSIVARWRLPSGQLYTGQWPLHDHHRTGHRGPGLGGSGPLQQVSMGSHRYDPSHRALVDAQTCHAYHEDVICCSTVACLANQTHGDPWVDKQSAIAKRPVEMIMNCLEASGSLDARGRKRMTLFHRSRDRSAECIVSTVQSAVLGSRLRGRSKQTRERLLRLRFVLAQSGVGGVDLPGERCSALHSEESSARSTRDCALLWSQSCSTKEFGTGQVLFCRSCHRDGVPFSAQGQCAVLG